RSDYLSDRAVGINRNEESSGVEATQQWRCLALERFEALANDGCGVIDPSSRREPLQRDLVGHSSSIAASRPSGTSHSRSASSWLRFRGKPTSSNPRSRTSARPK